MQVVVELQANKVVDELVDGDAACRAHIFRAEFDFRLALEHGFFDIDGNSAYYAVADVGEFLILAVELLDRSADSLAEGSLVCTALYGVLTVDERVILLTCLVGVCEGYLYIFAHDVNDRIEWIDCHCFGQQVEQTVLGEKLPPVVVQRQAGVQIRVVAHHCFDIIITELVVLKQSFRIVGHELDARAAFHCVGRVNDIGIADQMSLSERDTAHLTFSHGLHDELFRQSVNGFGTHAVQTDRFLERLAVVLTACVQNGNSVHHLTQRYTSAVIPDGYASVRHGHFDHLAFAHAELVDGVIDGFLDEHIYTII